MQQHQEKKTKHVGDSQARHFYLLCLQCHVKCHTLCMLYSSFFATYHSSRYRDHRPHQPWRTPIVTSIQKLGPFKQHIVRRSYWFVA